MDDTTEPDGPMPTCFSPESYRAEVARRKAAERERDELALQAERLIGDAERHNALLSRGTHLVALPLTRDKANAAIKKWHRHHKCVVGYRFAIAALSGDEIVGVAIVGRPRARLTDQYRIAEVSRVATNGHRNACSFLYARCARAADAMGFDSIQTFTLPEEPGTSLKAAGWVDEGIQPTHGEGREGSRPGRRRDQPEGPKRRWRMWLNRRPATKDLRAGDPRTPAPTPECAG